MLHTNKDLPLKSVERQAFLFHFNSHWFSRHKLITKQKIKLTNKFNRYRLIISSQRDSYLEEILSS